eukprot:1826477-Pleurochrysis_carterae.AAC.3
MELIRQSDCDRAMRSSAWPGEEEQPLGRCHLVRRVEVRGDVPGIGARCMPRRGDGGAERSVVCTTYASDDRSDDAQKLQ